MSQIIYLPVEQLYPHPDNPRRELGDLAELSDSIKANGIYQNLTVIKGHHITDEEWEELATAIQEAPDESARTAMNSRWSTEGYTVIIGHRRLAAAKQAGLKEVPCVIAEMTEQEQVQTMLLENMQRSDLKIYEQAKGFQMLLDFGSSIEEISERSGFSQNTVRRRVKLMALDQKKLKKAVDENQISLSDFDKLSKIDDIDERNKVLGYIGRTDFDYYVRDALRKQAIKQVTPEVKKMLHSLNATEIKDSDRWSNKYKRISEKPSFDFTKWEEEKKSFPTKAKKPIYYYLDKRFGEVVLYVEAEKQKPQRKTQAEIEKAKKIKSEWKYLKEQSKLLYVLRREFVEKLTYNNQNTKLILEGSLFAGALHAIDYNRADSKLIAKLLDMESNQYYSGRGMDALVAVEKMEKNMVPLVVYALFGDNPDELVIDNAYSETDHPVYVPRARLIALYKWLEGLGYEMAGIEKDLVYGTDKVYQQKGMNKDVAV